LLRLIDGHPSEDNYFAWQALRTIPVRATAACRPICRRASLRGCAMARA
jgi:hypothetical protein